MPTEMFLNKAVDLLVNQEQSIKLLSNQINNIYYIIKLFFYFYSMHCCAYYHIYSDILLISF